MVHLTFSRSIVELARLASGCESEQLLENSGITQIYWWNYTHMETVSGKSFLNVSIDPKYLVTSLFILPNLGLEKRKVSVLLYIHHLYHCTRRQHDHIRC